MTARASDYDSWSLQPEDLKDETTKRSIYFSSRDGVRTLASKLEIFDRLAGQSLGNPEEK